MASPYKSNTSLFNEVLFVVYIKKMGYMKGTL